MDTIRTLADPALVARFQRLFGVELIKPGTCDQQTQTKRPSLSNSEADDGTDTTCDGETPLATKTCEHISEENCSVCDHQSVVTKLSCSDFLLSSTRKRNSTCKDIEHNNNGISLNLTNLEQKYLGVANHDKENGIDGDRISLINHCNGHFINSCDVRLLENTADKASTESFRSISGEKTTKTNTPVSDEKTTKTEPEQAIRIKYKSLLYLARFGAFLGNEEFYLTFFPFCFWNLDSLIVRQVSLLWVLVMYLGQATKDYLRWPRPQCPPVIRLETVYLQEFAMPSTHAMAGTAIPLYLAFIAIVRYQVSFPVAASLALLWFSVTCFSRLYLGVHTVLDLIAGTLYAVIIFFTFIRYVEGYDLYQQMHPFAPFMILTTALLMCTFFYPSSHKNSSKGDAVQIVSAVAGCAIGAWTLFQLEFTHKAEVIKPFEIEAPTLSWFTFSMLRFISGLIVLAISYVTIRKFTIQSFSYLYGLDVPDKNNPSVMTAYKFTTYFALGFIISCSIPLMHAWLNIARPNLFKEVM